MAYNKLSREEEDIIEGKGTETPFTGEYDDFYEDGVFICRRCNAPLFSSESKFDVGCGWPAFDAEYPDSIKRLTDADPDLIGADGEGTEIQCANCNAHLGHEFTGEHLTDKNVRECVNSLSIKFISEDQKLPEVMKS